MSGADRRERLLDHDACIVADVCKHGGLEEMALVEMRRPAAAGEQPRPAPDRIGDQLERGVDRAGADHRPHGDALLEAVADDDRPGRIDEALLERLPDAGMDVETRGRDAHLAGIAELGRGDRLGGGPRIGVAMDDHRGVAAELHRHAFDAGGGLRQHLLAHRDRAGERHLADHRHRREVPGRQRQADADRLIDDRHTLVASPPGNRLAVDALGFFGVPLELVGGGLGLTGTVAVVEHLGGETLVYVAVDGADDLVTVELRGHGNVRIGERVALSIDVEASYAFGVDGQALPGHRRRSHPAAR